MKGCEIYIYIYVINGPLLECRGGRGASAGLLHVFVQLHSVGRLPDANLKLFCFYLIKY